MASLRLEGLTKKFGSVVAVSELTLEVGDGEFIALLGPSGCGKTTTLLMIAGIYRPTAGKIYFDEVLMNDVAPKDRYVGLVFQSYALYPHMTVYQNIAFPLRLAKRPKEEIDRKVKEVAALTKIEKLLDRRPGQLSGGQQQRVALCRALVKEPEILLLDEPLSNLDARLRIETRAEIKRLQRELGITSILVTHDQVEAMTMAERIAVMHSGVLQQYDPPGVLYDRPKNLFVASFIGDPPMNLISMKVMEREGQLILSADGFHLPVPEGLRERLSSFMGEEVVLGLRPEDMTLAREERPGSIPGEVFLTEPLGGGTLVHFTFGDVKLRVLAPREQPVEVGDRLWIVLQEEKVHVFGPDGRSLRDSDAAA
ncbi:MAG TPA: ABC transporter ATP-binding protein [Candidatus Acetothermia bacterium]|nr:ABC transporter ATP-binding protein [Candidatus Acetothermia bacterium]